MASHEDVPANGERRENRSELASDITSVTHRTHAINAQGLYAVTYLISTAAFLFGVNTHSFAQLRYKFVGNLLPEYVLCTRRSTVVVLIVMWGLHLVRRVAEALFVKRSDRRLSPFVALMTALFHVTFALWIGWSINFYLGYRTPMFWILISGVVVFLAGEIGCIVANVRLRRLRKERPASAVSVISYKPKGLLFRCTSRPQYVFHVMTYVGLTLSTFSLAAVVFLCINVIITALVMHKRRGTYHLKQMSQNQNAEHV